MITGYLKQQLKCVVDAYVDVDGGMLELHPCYQSHPFSFGFGFSGLFAHGCHDVVYVCVPLCLCGSSEPVCHGSVMVGFVFFYCLSFLLGEISVLLKVYGFNLTNIICLKIQTRLQAKLLYCDEIPYGFLF